MQEIYEFETNLSGRCGICKWCSISKIEINNNKLKIDNKIYKSKDMFNNLKNCSGNYEINNIKYVKFSSKQLGGVILILLNLVMLYSIIYFIVNYNVNVNAYRNLSGTGLGILIVLWLFSMMALRIKTIKVEFYDNKSIHIPIKSFLGGYLSIEYKKKIIEFMNCIK